MAKIKTAKRSTSAKGPAAALLLCFAGGAAAGSLLLAFSALLLAHTPLPLAAAWPMACLSAAAGAAVSGNLLAKAAGRQPLLCGLACGGFYVLCLAGAALVQNGTLNWQGSGAMLPIALLLGGCLGGSLQAVRGHS